MIGFTDFRCGNLKLAFQKESTNKGYYTSIIIIFDNLLDVGVVNNR